MLKIFKNRKHKNSFYDFTELLQEYHIQFDKFNSYTKEELKEYERKERSKIIKEKLEKLCSKLEI